mgnify:CR=1 FL=1
MLNYETIKETAKRIKRPTSDLLALSPVNDPFYAGVGQRAKEGAWFADLWRDYGSSGVHLRRIHYRLVTADGDPILRPDGREYRNAMDDWQLLARASLAARYLGLIAFDDIIDRRNDEAAIYADMEADPTAEREVSAKTVFNFPDVQIPDFPLLPELALDGLDERAAAQNYVAEVWIEKSTQNDWLVPLCRRRGVNLVVGLGEMSETRCRELALRAAECKAPIRILYLSDFDPGGRSMPKAASRKIEFTVNRLGFDADIQLIPVALTPEQCSNYGLPRTPIKNTERRRDTFERRFGVGATELDALEAVQPGEMARLVDDELDNWLDASLKNRLWETRSDLNLELSKADDRVRERHSQKIQELTNQFSQITEDLEEWETAASELWETINDDLYAERPDFSSVTVPTSAAPGITDRFVLFDSKRDYFSQLDNYHNWRDGTK